MSAAGILRRGRRAAERLMLDTVRIVRPGDTTTDPETGAVTTADTTLYSGKGRWVAGTTASQEADVATAAIIFTPQAVHIPVGDTLYLPGDIAECVTCPTAPFLAGSKARVTSMPGGSLLTALRIPVEAL